MCHVHHDTVGKVAISLAESAGENYERPTRRRYIDKHGNECSCFLRRMGGQLVVEIECRSNIRPLHQMMRWVGFLVCRVSLWWYRIRFAETLKIDLSLCKPYKRNHYRGDPTKHYENVLRGDQSGRFSF